MEAHQLNRSELALESNHTWGELLPHADLVHHLVDRLQSRAIHLAIKDVMVMAETVNPQIDTQPRQRRKRTTVPNIKESAIRNNNCMPCLPAWHELIEQASGHELLRCHVDWVEGQLGPSCNNLFIPCNAQAPLRNLDFGTPPNVHLDHQLCLEELVPILRYFVHVVVLHTAPLPCLFLAHIDGALAEKARRLILVEAAFCLVENMVDEI
mmetsp:Transcript_52517/g.151346  ORF Transcript_52517/g.151346 Transcript_52517/m.151346 type:complete len:210 (-) Transcript_52517:1477-2106(-)